MRTDKAVRLRRRLAIFVAGGPIADLTCALFAETLIVGGVPIPWLWFARLFLWLSLVALLFDVIPYRLRGFATDGARLLTLAVSPAQTKRWLSLAALERQMEREPQARHWNRHWLKVAASVEDQAREAQRANWLAYAHADAVDDVAAAAKYLERCLALAGAGDPGFRRLVILEAAVFTAWSRRDAAKAGAWFAKVPQPRRLTPLLRLRGEVARQWVQGNSEAAMLSWSKALDLIRNLPDTPQRVALESSWQEWKQQLTERNPKSH